MKVITCIIVVVMACISFNPARAGETPSGERLLGEAKNSLKASDFEQAILNALEAKKHCTNDSECLAQITDIIRISHGHMAISCSSAFINQIRSVERMTIFFNRHSLINKSCRSGILKYRMRYKMALAMALYISGQMHMSERNNQSKSSASQGVSAAEMKAGVYYNAAQALIRKGKGKEALRELSNAWESLDVAKKIFLVNSNEKKEIDKSPPRAISQI